MPTSSHKQIHCAAGAHAERKGPPCLACLLGCGSTHDTSDEYWSKNRLRQLESDGVAELRVVVLPRRGRRWRAARGSGVPLRAVAPWFLPPGHVARSGCTEGRGRRAKPGSEREADDARIEGEQAWAAPMTCQGGRSRPSAPGCWRVGRRQSTGRQSHYYRFSLLSRFQTVFCPDFGTGTRLP